MKKRGLITGVLGAVLCLQTGPAFADSTATGSALTDNPCPPQRPVMPPQMRAAMMKSGVKPLVVAPAQMEAYRRVQEAERAKDFANVCRYKAENAHLAQSRHPQIVFMGDSITEAWSLGDPALFAPDVIDRGITGQTSAQMVLRFYQDVVALRPRVVHIMAGTNDLAGNTGPSTPEDYKNNIRAMVDLARANGIKVILASILPSDHFAWQPDFRPADQVRQLNAWLRQFSRERGLVFADYYSAMSSPTGGMKPELSNDGVHPTFAGYAVMRPIFDAALARARVRTKR